MTTRKAYAISENGKMALVFASKALRDFFVERADGIEVTTCAEYRKVERKENERDEWGNNVNIEYSAIDMGISEYWDGEWSEIYDEAYEAGLL